MPNIDDHVTVKEAKWVRTHPHRPGERGGERTIQVSSGSTCLNPQSEVCMTLRQARSEHLTMRAIPKMPEIEDKKVSTLYRQGGMNSRGQATGAE
jgi:hypothetical protein